MTWGDFSISVSSVIINNWQYSVASCLRHVAQNRAFAILGISSWVRGADNIGGKLDHDDVEEFHIGAVPSAGIGNERAVDL